MLFLCKRVILEGRGIGSVSYIHEVALPPADEGLAVLTADDVDGPCVFIDLDHKSYICDIPNFLERD